VDEKVTGIKEIKTQNAIRIHDGMQAYAALTKLKSGDTSPAARAVFDAHKENLGYGLLYLITVLIRWPLFGVLYGVITQTGTAWRRDPDLLKGFSRATLVFVGLFAIRLIVQVPLYFTGSLNALGIAKIGLGLPFYALAIWLAYAVLRGSMPAEKWAEARDSITHLLRGNKK